MRVFRTNEPITVLTEVVIIEALCEAGSYVHVFTDDPIYRKCYEDTFYAWVDAKNLTFGPHAAKTPDEVQARTAQNPYQRVFKRHSSAVEAAIDFTIMGLCGEFHGTSGSTVIHFVEWIHAKYASGPQVHSTIGDWSPGGATRDFKNGMNSIMAKTSKLILHPDEFGLRHIQANVLDFLAGNHLTEMYNYIASALEKPPHRVIAAVWVKDEFLKNCHVAKLNRKKYIERSSDTKDNDTKKGQHWFNALLKYKLKPFALTKNPPGWMFDVNTDGYLVRTSVQSRSAKKRSSSIPPWREEPSSASSSGLAPWREPITKKQRITE